MAQTAISGVKGLKAHEYKKLCAIIYERAGIKLGNGKEQLLAARVSKRMAAVGVSETARYMALLDGADKEKELALLIDVVTTNFTSFFREEVHFEILRKWATKRFSLGAKKLRVWSAASSTGEEPYTLAMSLLDLIGNRTIDLKILASDISPTVLKTATKATYDARQLSGIPAPMQAKYCKLSADKRTFTMSREARDIVLFRLLNLSALPYPLRGPLDAIFCRNVMIYFDNEVRQRFVSQAQKLLRPGGLLFIGHSESISSLESSFRGVVPSVYVNEAGRSKGARASKGAKR